MADGKQEFGGHSARTDKPIARGWLAVGGLAAAIGATSCCVLPLALFALGISGAWIGNITALAPYQFYFIAAALIMLSLGFYRVYRQPPARCDEDVSCARPASTRLVKIALWTAALLVALALAFPYVAPLLIGA